VALLALLPAASTAEVPPVPLPLAWCLDRAEGANPAIAVDVAEAEAARERVTPAGALDDPRLGYQASNVPVGELDFRSTPLSGHQFGLAQKLPFPGLLGNRRKAARAAAESSESGVVDRRLSVAAAVERAWAELGFAQRALEITDRNTDLVRQLARIAETKYAVGTGLQQDVLRAQVTLTGILDERLMREAAIARAEAQLAGLLDLEPGVRLARTEELDQEIPLPVLEPILASLEESSPRLRALEARVQEAERLRRAAQLEGYPDFDLGFGYRVRSRVVGDPVNGEDFLSAGVTIRLPINRAKWRARVAERDALIRRARAEHRRERAALRDAVRSRYAELRRATSEVALMRDGLIPQARQSLESSRSAYEVDKVDFLSLIDSQVILLDAELRLVRAQADRRSAIAALEADAGRELR